MTGEPCDIGILFGDIAGSTRFYESLGDRHALSVIGNCLQILADCVRQSKGTVVKTIGDELMAAFTDPSDMFECALDMQRRVDEMPTLVTQPATLKIALRIGISFGPALRSGADYFGDTVNTAARMTSLARAKQIVTTGELLDRLSPAQRARGMEFGKINVRGRQEPVRAAFVRWNAEEESKTIFPRSAPVASPAEAGSNLTLAVGDQEWIFDSARRSIGIGRDHSNDIVLSSQHVSRSHATIERRRDKWVLVDHSTNGSFIVLPGQPEFRLHLEDLILSGTGVIAFGRKGDMHEDFLRFSIN